MVFNLIDCPDGTLDILQLGEELGRAALARRQAAEIFEQLRACRQAIGGQVRSAMTLRDGTNCGAIEAARGMIPIFGGTRFHPTPDHNLRAMHARNRG